MGYLLKARTGNIRAAETDYLIEPTRNVRRSGYGGIFLHGSGAPNEWADPLSYESSKLAANIAAAGIPCVAGTMSGQAWGNDAEVTDVGNAFDYLVAETGVPDTKVFLIGASMGGVAMIRWANANPTKVAGIVGIIPLTNLAYFYANNIGGAGAQIGTAWGVTYPAALPAGSDTQAMAASLAGIPGRIYYSGSDATIRPVDSTGFASAAGWTATNLGTLGHSENTIGQLVDLGAGHSAEVIDFLKANGA